MHQREPIKIDKSRAFSAKNGPVSSSTQVSFHKIYRQKRCYSLVDKEQEGHGSSQWKAGSTNSQREKNAGFRSNYSFGSDSLKPNRSSDSTQINNYSSYSVSPPNRESAKNCRQHFKRPNDRLGCNSVCGPEYDVPFVKKQKVENYKLPAHHHFTSPEVGQDKQKIVLDDTKWMYKNQHAKMSGPYGVRQLVEGFDAHFLKEDLPVYQLHEGKLCRPIMLKQLIDDMESCNLLKHNPLRHVDQSFSEGFRQVAPPCKGAKDMDLPPGFGGRSAQLSERPSSIQMPNSTMSPAAPKHCIGAFSPSFPDVGVAEFGVPPGFEAVASTAYLTEQHITELPGTSRRLPTCSRVAVRSEVTEGMQSSYEKFEPVVHGQGRSSHQGSSPRSKVSFTTRGAKSLSGNSMQAEPIVYSRGHLCQQGSSPPSKGNFALQGTRSMNENSSRHTTWAFASPNSTVSSVEAQTFSSPTVCIGLPVGIPAVQNWPVGNNLPIAYAQASNGLLPKQYSEISGSHGSTPVALIHLELLAAVKRSYVKTVLSALIDEQLNCWIDGQDTMVKPSLQEDGSYPKEASSLSSAEFGVTCMESSTVQTGASTFLPKHHTGSEETLSQIKGAQSSDGSYLNAHVGSAETSLEMRTSQCYDCGGLNDQFTCIEEYQCSSAEAFCTRSTSTPFAMTDARSPSGTEQNSLGTNMIPVIRTSAELDLDKGESHISCDEGSRLSFRSSLLGNSFDSFKQVVVDQKEEAQHQLENEILQGDGAFEDKVQPPGNTSDTARLETEVSFLGSGKKKWKVKSLKRLLQITSKLRPRDLKITSSMNKKEEMSFGMVPEALETRLQNGVLISHNYDGCARTSFDGWLWRKLARCAPHSESFQRDHSISCTQLNAVTAQTYHAHVRKFSAAADSSFIPKLRQSKAKLKLARSKIHEWGVFAVEPVEAGVFVIEYVGEVVRQRVSDLRDQCYKHSGIGSSFLFHVDDMVVDATKRGGLARFMNYSCDPNCSAKIVTVEGSKKVHIYAIRHITAGEELTYDCKFQREDQKTSCNCGSTRYADCRVLFALFILQLPSCSVSQ